jgi:hypothetical protein
MRLLVVLMLLVIPIPHWPAPEKMWDTGPMYRDTEKNRRMSACFGKDRSTESIKKCVEEVGKEN